MAQEFADKEYYLIDSLVLEELSEGDKELLKTSLDKYHSTKDDTIKINDFPASQFLCCTGRGHQPRAEAVQATELGHSEIEDSPRAQRARPARRVKRRTQFGTAKHLVAKKSP